MANPNYVFPSNETDSVICEKFKAISWKFANFDKLKQIKQSG